MPKGGWVIAGLLLLPLPLPRLEAHVCARRASLRVAVLGGWAFEATEAEQWPKLKLS